jgi:membrane protein
MAVGPARTMPRLRWRAVVSAFRGLGVRYGLEISGHIAFVTMLSLLPFLMFLISLAGFLGETRIGQDFISTLALFAPPEVLATLQPAIEHVIRTRSGSVLTIGLLLSLYSAGSGVATLRLALNLSYNLTETRPFWYRKGQDLVIVLLGSVVLILSSLAIILGPQIWRFVESVAPVGTGDRRLWHLGRYGFSLVMILAGVIALHRLLPNERLTLAQILPGAVATTIAWVAAASLLTLYFDQFADYSATYGSLGGVIVTLLFFYISGIIFIFGGELNAALLRRHVRTARTKES